MTLALNSSIPIGFSSSSSSSEEPELLPEL